MTIERAIEILNPEHREHYDSIETVNEACRMGMEALERTRWIPVEKESPPEGELILCSDGNVVFQSMFVTGIWVLDNVARGLQPTRWMPFPEPPEVEQ